MPSIAGDYAEFVRETQRLDALLASTVDMEPAHRKFLAEIVLLRLAILIENKMKVVLCKLSCGAPYLDGTVPILLAQQRNIPQAEQAMKTLNRDRPRNLPWNNGSEIRTNVEHLIDATDPVIAHLRNYGSYLADVRFIRNHIAHRNDGTRRNFHNLVRRYYGGRVAGVTCGNLLVTRRTGPTPLITKHIVSARVMMKDIARA